VRTEDKFQNAAEYACPTCVQKGEMMITEIGFVAGDIWNYLDKHGEVSFNTMVKAIDKPRDLALMSLGWLAREGHVEVVRSGNDYKVKLRSKS
jgi:hypothetical protein